MASNGHCFGCCHFRPSSSLVCKEEEEEEESKRLGRGEAGCAVGAGGERNG
jgi:hypothetical protein